MICKKCGKEVPDGAYCCRCGAAQAPAAHTPRRRGNGTGTVIKRGSTWTAIVTVGHYIDQDGRYHQQRRTKGGFRTRRDATNYLPVLAKSAEKASPTLSDLWAAYKAGRYRKLSAGKQQSYTRSMGRWGEILGRKIADVTQHQLQDILNRKAPTHYIAKDMQSVMSHLYQIAIWDQVVPVNLARTLTLPPLEEEVPEPFSADELQRLWAAYDASPDRQIYGSILLMIYSGMMPGELIKLAVSNIDLDACEISGVGLKTNIRRAAPIIYPDNLRPLVADLCDHAAPDGRIIDCAMTTYRLRYYKAIDAAGVRHLPPYSCRHTTATALALSNTAPSTIQRIMRHGDLTTTQRYIHIDNDTAHSAVDALNVPQKPV